MACFDDEASLLPPQGEPVRGRTAVEAHYRALFARERLELEITFDETMVSGGYATVRGHTTGRRTPLAGVTAVAVDDAFTAVLRRTPDRAWRVLQLSWKPSPDQR